VTLYLIDAPEQKRSIGELQADADEAQMADSAYRKELGYWVGTGALGSSWLMARIGQAVVSHFDLGDREGRKNSKLIERAPVIALLATHADTPTARVKTGQVFDDSHFSRVLKHRRPSNESDLGTARNANKTRCWG